MTASAPGSNSATEIVNDLLGGLPLALEQAAILLRKGVVKLDNFVREYRVRYTELMGHSPKPGEVQHDKSRSICAALGGIIRLYYCPGVSYFKSGDIDRAKECTDLALNLAENKSTEFDKFSSLHKLVSWASDDAAISQPFQYMVAIASRRERPRRSRAFVRFKVAIEPDGMSLR
ncbi:hypothetical protein F5Y11DRAFT_343866 [Daldinia sp. FL1419]|nr:hypothetical protein F5Y11DRAFT_343866 [Daldinia sp. FL1419]